MHGDGVRRERRTHQDGDHEQVCRPGVVFKVDAFKVHRLRVMADEDCDRAGAHTPLDLDQIRHFPLL
eukprot:2976220-Rhodomonas_salina.1